MKLFLCNKNLLMSLVAHINRLQWLWEPGTEPGESSGSNNSWEDEGFWEDVNVELAEDVSQELVEAVSGIVSAIQKKKAIVLFASLLVGTIIKGTIDAVSIPSQGVGSQAKTEENDDDDNDTKCDPSAEAGQDSYPCPDDRCKGAEGRCNEGDDKDCACVEMDEGPPYLQKVEMSWLDDQQKILGEVVDEYGTETKTDAGVITDGPAITPTPSCTKYEEQESGACRMLLYPSTEGKECPPSTTEGQICTGLGESAEPTVTCGSPLDNKDSGDDYGRFTVASDMESTSSTRDDALKTIDNMSDTDLILNHVNPWVVTQYDGNDRAGGGYIVDYTVKTGDNWWCFKLAASRNQSDCSPQTKFQLNENKKMVQKSFTSIIDECNTDTVEEKHGGFARLSSIYGCLDFQAFPFSSSLRT